MYKNILVPIDPGHKARHEQAFKMATALSDETGAKITALTVVEPLPAYIGVAAVIPDLDSEIRENVTTALAEFVAGKDIETVILHGVPGTVIVDYAKENGVDCIVIASHKPGFGDFLLGSTAARVVRHAPCGVHVLR